MEANPKADKIICDTITKYQFQIYELWMKGKKTLAINEFWNEIKYKSDDRYLSFDYIEGLSFETEIFIIHFTNLYEYSNFRFTYSPFELIIK